MNKILKILICLYLCVFLFACGEEYADTNGADNYTLQTITDSNIINLELGASGLGYKEQNIAGVVFSNEYYSKNFNGVERIYNTNFILPSDVMIYIGYLTVDSGNFRMVIVNDDKIIYDVESGAFNEMLRFDNLKGNFAIHLAGESADFELNLEVQ